MPYFPNEKTIDNRKPPTADQFAEMLRNGNDRLFPPFDLRMESRIEHPSRVSYTGVLTATWKSQTARYAVEYKPSSAPLVVTEAAHRLASMPWPGDLSPLVIVPYLSESNLDILDKAEVSGMDLCGNGLLLNPFHARHSGNPNKYKDSRAIRNPFNGDSSIFARCFLLQRRFKSLTQLREFALRRASSDTCDPRSPGFALGTASKVITALEEQLVIRRSAGGIELQDARRLISLLRLGQRRVERAAVIGKTQLSYDEVWNQFAAALREGKFRAVATGLSSAGKYKVLSGVDRLSLYVDDLKTAGELLGVRPGKAFANIELFEDHKNMVYFDSRAEGNVRWASPIQTWLELSAAGPREQEAADELEGLLANGRGDTLL